MKVPCGKNAETGERIFVAEVPSGECILPLVVCPECDHPLQAKKGKEKIHHFSHMPKIPTIKGHKEYNWKENKASCSATPETHIHKLAKSIITEQMKIRLPDIDFYDCLTGSGAREMLDQYSCSEGLRAIDRIIRFDAISQEQRVYMGNSYYIADIMGSIEPFNRQLTVELALTNIVTWEKKAKIKKAKISAIEIKLNKEIVQHFSREQEWVTYVVDAADRYWIYNDKLDRLRQELVRFRRLHIPEDSIRKWMREFEIKVVG